MSTKYFFLLYDMVCSTNKFLSESHGEVSDICTLLKLDKVPSLSEILSGKNTIKNYTPEQIIELLQTALYEYKKLQVNNKAGKQQLTLEDAARVREAENRFVEETFTTVLMMKLLRAYF